jgi:hypothetical protein
MITKDNQGNLPVGQGERLGMQMDATTFEHPGVPDGHVLQTHCNCRYKSWIMADTT